MAKSIKIKQTYPRTNQEAYEFMVKKFREIDLAMDSELADLALIGTRPTCSRGCPHCCRQLVLAAPLEGATLIHFIKTTFPTDYQAKIVERNRHWLAWRKDELPNYIKNGDSAGSAHYNKGPFCPLLENGECSVYPVRPLACRGHFVSSDPRGCRPIGDPQYIPNIYTEIVLRSPIPIGTNIRKISLKKGIDPLRDGKLIPEWLEMITV